MNIGKIAGTLFLLVGLIVLVLFAAADIFGVGENPFIFGTWQIGGSIVGIVLIIIGLVLLVKKNRRITDGESGPSN